MTTTPSHIREAVWTVWMAALSQHWPDWPETNQAAAASTIQQDLGAIFTRLNKACSSPIKDELIALARHAIPTLEEEWKRVYDEHYPALCSMICSTFQSITYEEAHDFIQPFASRTIPWMLLKLRLLQEPAIHEEVRYLLRENAATRSSLRQMLWAKQQGACFGLQDIHAQLDALAAATHQSRESLEQTIEQQTTQWFTQERSTQRGRQTLVELAAETLGPLWDALYTNYPHQISRWELFRRLLIDPPIRWRAYLGRCAYHLCQRYLRQQAKQQALAHEPAQAAPQAQESSHEQDTDALTHQLLDQLAEWIQEHIDAQIAEQRTKRAYVWRRRLWVLYSHWLDDTPKQTLAASFQTAASTITSDCAAIALLPLRIHRTQLLTLFHTKATETQSNNPKEAQDWIRRKELLQRALQPETPYRLSQLAQQTDTPLAIVKEDWRQMMECCVEIQFQT